MRVEVNVKRADAEIIRAVAEALGDPEREADVRAWVRRELCVRPVQSFKTLLVSAPIEDIDVERATDMGRAVDI